MAEANLPVPTNGLPGGFETLLANVRSKQISFLIITNLFPPILLPNPLHFTGFISAAVGSPA